jgi:hypothetical protein
MGGAENKKKVGGGVKGRDARLQPMEKRRALLSIGVTAGSGSERDDERKGSPLYR